MAAKDENIPRLGSIPPEEEEEAEVTRVGSRDEIQRLVQEGGRDANGVRLNNLPTPPAPPPDAQMREVLGVSSAVRLAPPSTELLGMRPNDMPTKPPTAGAVGDADVDAAFRDSSLDEQELDSSLLEPAPASSRAVPGAPPLPASARSRAPSAAPNDTPVFPPAPLLPGAAAAAAKKAAEPPSRIADGPEDDVDESRSRPIRSPLESNPSAEVLSVMPKAPPPEPALARPSRKAPPATSNTKAFVLVGLALVTLVVLALLSR